jgi:protein TonB
VYIPSTQQSVNNTPVKEEPKPVESPKPAPDTTAKTETPKTEAPKTEAPKVEGPLDVGSLVGYATRQASPVYPAAAKMMRATGIVRVDFTVDESGDVTDVQKTSGPQMLQAAAKDAIKKWKFKPFVRDGQPIKVNGFVNFNFSL